MNNRNNRAFNLVELCVVAAIVGLLAVTAIPVYTDYIQTTNVTKMVNKLGTLKIALTDKYTATGSWPASINGATSGSTVSTSFFSHATNFRYNTDGNKAWIGYQLDSGYGSGWIFMVIIATDDESFDIHCGSLNNTCTLGHCNSLAIYPTQCSETDLHATYTLE